MFRRTFPRHFFANEDVMCCATSLKQREQRGDKERIYPRSRSDTDGHQPLQYAERDALSRNSPSSDRLKSLPWATLLLLEVHLGAFTVIFIFDGEIKSSFSQRTKFLTIKRRSRRAIRRRRPSSQPSLRCSLRGWSNACVCRLPGTRSEDCGIR